ncbi:MAG: ZIP family metal transporter [Chromatocurvus sp.]
MTDYPGTLLVLYSAAIAAASLLGGLLPNVIRMTHTRTQLAMSLVSGLMLGVAFYHLLPHSIVMRSVPDAIDFSVRWLVVGLVVMLLLLRAFHFHQHEINTDSAVETVTAPSGPAAHDHHHLHGQAHAHSFAETPPPAAHRLSWVGIALGFGLHTLIDGVALGAALRGAETADAVSLLGAGVFLAILLHKPLDAMSITAVMQSGGWGVGAMKRVNIGFALLCPLGALLFYYGVDLVAIDPVNVVAAVLAFAAGAFICIALSDLLPEVHFHSHDRVKLTVVFLLGVGIAYAIVNLEPAGAHQHDAAVIQADGGNSSRQGHSEL